MTRIHNNEVKNISECNLLHDITNPPKQAKYLNRHYSPIIHGCINTRKGKPKFKRKNCILLDSGFSSTVVMEILVKRLGLEEDDPMQWNTQALNITANLKVKIDFTLPAISVTNHATQNFHVDESAKGRYDLILGRYLLIELGLYLKFYEHIIEADNGPFKWSTTLMVDLGTYIFKYLNAGKITPEEFFTNSYVKEVYKSENVRTATKQLHAILYAKYQKSDLHKVMENQCQRLTMTQRNELLQSLQRFKELFDGILGTWKRDAVYFKSKEDADPI